MFRYNTHDLLTTPGALPFRSHPFDPTIGKETVCLTEHGGEGTGQPRAELAQTGVRFCRLAPGAKSVPLHAHSHEDEWFYVISGAGPDAGACALIRGEMSAECDTEELVLRDGDFLAFPAGLKDARALRAGTDPLVYIVGGSRAMGDTCVYPELEKVFFVDKSSNGAHFLADGQNVKWINFKPSK